MKKKIFIGVFIFVAINIVVACAGMDGEEGVFKPLMEHLLSHSDEGETDSGFKYTSEEWLGITGASTLKGLAKDLGICGVVHVNNPYPGYVHVNIRFDPIYNTHQCDHWNDLVRLSEVYIHGGCSKTSGLRKDDSRGHIKLSFYFNDLSRGGDVKVYGTFRWARRGEDKRIILFSANSEKNPRSLHSLRMSIEKEGDSWEIVSVQIFNGNHEFAYTLFQDFTSADESR